MTKKDKAQGPLLPADSPGLLIENAPYRSAATPHRQELMGG